MIERRRLLTLLALANVGNAVLVAGVLSWGWLAPDVFAQAETPAPPVVEPSFELPPVEPPDEDEEAPSLAALEGSGAGTELAELGAAEARRTYEELVARLMERGAHLDEREADVAERERQLGVLAEQLRREREGIEARREEIAAERLAMEQLTSPSFDRLLKAYEGMEPTNAASALAELYGRDRMVVVDLLLGLKPRQAAGTLDALAATSPSIAADLSLEIWKKDPARRR